MRLYDRYFRWAARWQPHMDYLEIEEGVNLYSKRRSSRENRLTARRRITFVQETPELMDETARGPWLEFLSDQGLTYLKAHVKYLVQGLTAIPSSYDLVFIAQLHQGTAQNKEYPLVVVNDQYVLAYAHSR